MHSFFPMVLYTNEFEEDLKIFGMEARNSINLLCLYVFVLPHKRPIDSAFMQTDPNNKRRERERKIRVRNISYSILFRNRCLLLTEFLENFFIFGMPWQGAIPGKIEKLTKTIILCSPPPPVPLRQNLPRFCNALASMRLVKIILWFSNRVILLFLNQRFLF